MYLGPSLCVFTMVVAVGSQCYHADQHYDSVFNTALHHPNRSLESLKADSSLDVVSSHFIDDHNYETVVGVGTYKLHRVPASWRDSYRKCVNEGAHLAVVDSVLEAEALKYLLKERNIKNNRNYSLYINIGIHSQFSDGCWTTIFGEPIHIGYEVWAKHQPDDFGQIERCGAINYEAELEDIPCDGFDYPFICERRLEHDRNCDYSRGIDYS